MLINIANDRILDHLEIFYLLNYSKCNNTQFCFSSLLTLFSHVAGIHVGLCAWVYSMHIFSFYLVISELLCSACFYIHPLYVAHSHFPSSGVQSSGCHDYLLMKHLGWKFALRKTQHTDWNHVFDETFC